MKIAQVSLLHGKEKVRDEMLKLFDEKSDYKIVVWSKINEDEVKQDILQLKDKGVNVLTFSDSLTYGEAIMRAAKLLDDDVALVYTSGRRAVVHESGWIEDITKPLEKKWCGMAGSVRPCQYSSIARIQTDIFEPQIHVQGGCFAIRVGLLKDCTFGKFPQVYSDVFLSHAVIKRGFYLEDVKEIVCNEGWAVDQVAKLSVGYPDRTNRNNKFNEISSTPSDINEHMSTLRFYAGRSSRILEFGTYRCFSTLAFLCGEPDKLTTVDIDPSSVQKDAVDFLKQNAGCTSFIQEINDSRTRTQEWADLLFIDTDHNYDCLSAELNRHHAYTTRWIIMHDTVCYPDCMLAVQDFLKRERTFKLLQHFPNNNGLTILERCS